MSDLDAWLDAPLRAVIPALQNRICFGTSYFGVPTLKNPLDFWVYQEILFEVRPDVIVEIGNYRGGSALALAHLCDALRTGRVIGVDLDHSAVPDTVRQHPRITLVDGDGAASVDAVRAMIRPDERVLIIEDSSHTYDNTLAILRAYAGLVSPGSYFIVEDGICWHGLDGGPKPGPYEAIASFLRETPAFVSDRSRESFLLTWNPQGFLKRTDGVPLASPAPVLPAAPVVSAPLGLVARWLKRAGFGA